jgi:hypothetical protein
MSMCVFEEASGRGPSIAEQLADSSQRPVQYVNFDPPPAERPKYGIAAEVGSGRAIDQCNCPDSCEFSAHACVFYFRQLLW